MGRGRTAIKEVEDAHSKQIVLNKRKAGLERKVQEIATLCGAQVGVIIFTWTGTVIEIADRASSLRQIVTRYMDVTQSKLDVPQGLQNQLKKPEVEGDKARLHHVISVLKNVTEEGLEGLSRDELQQLEDSLEECTSVVRKRKNKISMDRIRITKQDRDHAKALGRYYESLLHPQKRLRPLQPVPECHARQEVYPTVHPFLRREGQELHSLVRPLANDSNLRELQHDNSAEPQLELGLNLHIDSSLDSCTTTHNPYSFRELGSEECPRKA